ncbi:alpha/beta fold hydrolase [Staphylococcus shinii]|uniref:alpha/beta fold hydrolase n=1 Tax=Staphylococcus shinii TaxID=2912228 RepID=UPI00057C1B42|nr:alpha/beta hydrolase [Staphylococcus shinii]MDW8797129.1 alpha/beta hydrolase [Staphylococcus pseudoxylosus]
MKNGITSDNTYYVTAGTGEPLILIHGVGLDHTMWKEHVNYFSSYYQVFAYDMLGHGKSRKPDKEKYELQDFTEQLLNFMNELNIHKPHILGFSMGGMVAQSFGIVYKEKVKSLTISNAVAHRNDKERLSVQGRIQDVEEKGKNSTIEPAIERWFNDEFIRRHLNLINQIKQRLKNNDEDSYLKAYRVFGEADRLLWEDLCEINAPTLVITGQFDQGSNVRMAEEMVQRISQSKLIIIPEARHMLPLEKFQVFNQNVYEFLKNIDKEVKNN